MIIRLSNIVSFGDLGQNLELQMFNPFFLHRTTIPAVQQARILKMWKKLLIFTSYILFLFWYYFFKKKTILFIYLFLLNSKICNLLLVKETPSKKDYKNMSHSLMAIPFKQRIDWLCIQTGWRKFFFFFFLTAAPVDLCFRPVTKTE